MQNREGYQAILEYRRPCRRAIATAVMQFTGRTGCREAQAPLISSTAITKRALVSASPIAAPSSLRAHQRNIIASQNPSCIIAVLTPRGDLKLSDRSGGLSENVAS